MKIFFLGDIVGKSGRLAVINGAKCLESNMGGNGKLISGVPGVEPANVLILGGGITFDVF